MPDLVSYQVQYLVSYIVGLIGTLISDLSGAFTTFGASFTTAAGNGLQMQALTTGIFGDSNGLIYWINEKVFFVLKGLPYKEIGEGLAAIVKGLFG